MRFNVLLAAYLVFVGCSASHHLKRAQKQQNKAILKGATIDRDTIIKTKSDTITKIDTLNNTITITHTIKDTVFLEGSTKYVYKSRVEARQEQKTERKKAKYNLKENKKKLKQDAKTERKKVKHTEKTKRKEKKRLWWLWLCCGFILGYGIRDNIKNF